MQILVDFGLCGSRIEATVADVYNAYLDVYCD